MLFIQYKELTMRGFHPVVATVLTSLAVLGCSGEDKVGGFIEQTGQGGSGSGISLQADLSVAAPGGQYSDVLVECVTAPDGNESCFLSALPLLGQEVGKPTVDNIMARTVVSHSWMAERFRDVLEAMPTDVLNLFQAVTAVVIASDIRPSYYTPANGAIHLDPAKLWTTNEEKATVDKQDDYRADFGNDLAFTGLWRYMDGIDYAWDYYSLDGTETRSVTDLIRPMAALLFHELAHANDFFPPAELAGLDSSLTVYDAAIGLEDASISAQLDAAQPLNSQVWKDLAAVLYKGEDATSVQRAYSAETVGLEFASDGASDDYSYTTVYEDTAMLFEEVMLKYHYGLDRELAFTDAPDSADQGFCDAYIVRWGTRGRAGDTLVKARAEQVVQLMLDSTDVSTYLTGLGEPVALTNGDDWCVDIPVTTSIRAFDEMPAPARAPLRGEDRNPRH